VRIGNAAYQQLQLDIYGEMMDSIYLANKYGDAISYAGWQDVQRILAWLGKNWQRPDEGIWEVRGGAREFLHSRLMCWVAFDRALRLAQNRSLSAPFGDWLRTRDAIRADIFTNFWDDDLQSFVQSKGTKDLDALVLLMPLMRFISPVDPMWRSTMKAVEARLVEDTLVRRYEAERTHVDGIPGGEGSFTACSFGTSNAWRAPGSWERLNCCLRNSWDTRTTPDSIPVEWSKRATSRQLPASIHTSGADQHRKLSGQGPLRQRRLSVALACLELDASGAAPS
jgi:GH15 family glucan-1,4-alpha-glucosidase